MLLMQAVPLGRQGLTVAPPGPRLHGHVRVLRAGRRRRVDRDDPPRARARRDACSTRPTSTARTRTSGSSAARSPTGATGSCSRRSSGSCAIPRTRARRGGDGSRAYVRRSLRGLARATRRRPHRPLLPAPRRSRHADRGDDRRDGRARRRGQGALPRHLRGDAPRRSAARTPCTRSRRCRPSTRCGRASRRPRSCRRSASSASASCRTARSAAASSPGRRARSTSSTRTTSAASSPASRARTCSANIAIVEVIDALADREGRRLPRRSRSPGCTRRARTSCRSPGRSAAATSRRTSRRSTSGSSADDLARSNGAGSARGDRYADMSRINL